MNDSTVAPAKPVLDLSSLHPSRPWVTIDGVDYHYRVAMDLNLEHLARIAACDEELDRLVAQGRRSKRPSPQRAVKLSSIIRRGVGLVMYDPIPDEVLDKLNDTQRLAILEAFTKATSRAASQAISQARAAVQPPPNRSTSRRSSRGSSASTTRRSRRRG